MARRTSTMLCCVAGWPTASRRHGRSLQAGVQPPYGVRHSRIAAVRHAAGSSVQHGCIISKCTYKVSVLNSVCRTSSSIFTVFCIWNWCARTCCRLMSSDAAYLGITSLARAVYLHRSISKGWQSHHPRRISRGRSRRIQAKNPHQKTEKTSSMLTMLRVELISIMAISWRSTRQCAQRAEGRVGGREGGCAQ